VASRLLELKSFFFGTTLGAIFGLFVCDGC
jgi:hypothetical protein